jgi:hypothetical protein
LVLSLLLLALSLPFVRGTIITAREMCSIVAALQLLLFLSGTDEDEFGCEYEEPLFS